MSRVIEITDNLDGQLSIFTTLIDHIAPPSPSETIDDPVLWLASISRGLTSNDPMLTLLKQIGEPTDRNVELLTKAPFQLGSNGN